MTSLGWLLSSGIGVVVGGTLVCCAPNLVRVGLALQALGLALVGVAGAVVLTGNHEIGQGFSNDLHVVVGVDALSGFFLGVLAVAGVPALVYARGYLAGAANAAAIAATSGIFVLALVGVLIARDVVTFLLMWELMSMAPAAAILFAQRSAVVCRAVLIYLGITHLAGAGVWLSMLTLAHLGAFGDPDVLAGQSALMRSLLAGAALVGFGTKAGMMPFHMWLPRAHPVAPGHISAVMSGVMVKVALYGLVRMLFEWLAPVPGWVAPTLLAAAVLSCVSGVTYALLEDELKRLLAFSSIENVGIIGIGLAGALLAAGAGHINLAALAFAAAMLHTLNHALFKTLLFLCAGTFQRQVGDLDLNRLGGLLRTMPVTGAAFLVGAIAIAGVPPLNGFASEWLTLQALVQLALQGESVVVLSASVAAAALAASAAIALFCFVKVVGLVLLGAHRQKATAEAKEAPVTMTAPLVFLAGVCVVIGSVPGVVLGRIEHLSPFGPLPMSVGVGRLSLSDSGVFAPAALAACIVVLVALLQLLRRRATTAVQSPMWLCGQPQNARLAWTSAGFSKSFRLVLEAVLRPRRTVVIEQVGPVVRSVRHHAEVPQLYDDLLYGPVLRAANAGSRVIRRMQSGSLRAYLAYLLAALMVVLVLVRVGAA